MFIHVCHTCVSRKRGGVYNEVAVPLVSFAGVLEAVPKHLSIPFMRSDIQGNDFKALSPAGVLLRRAAKIETECYTSNVQAYRTSPNDLCRHWIPFMDKIGFRIIDISHGDTSKKALWNCRPPACAVTQEHVDKVCNADFAKNGREYNPDSVGISECNIIWERVGAADDPSYNGLRVDAGIGPAPSIPTLKALETVAEVHLYIGSRHRSVLPARSSVGSVAPQETPAFAQLSKTQQDCVNLYLKHCVMPQINWGNLLDEASTTGPTRKAWSSLGCDNVQTYAPRPQPKPGQSKIANLGFAPSDHVVSMYKVCADDRETGSQTFTFPALVTPSSNSPAFVVLPGAKIAAVTIPIVNVFKTFPASVQRVWLHGDVRNDNALNLAQIVAAAASQNGWAPNSEHKAPNSETQTPPPPWEFIRQN